MALTRKMLAGLGLEEAAIQAIIEAHTETTDALKADRDAFKADADKLPDIQKELDDLKAKKTEPDEWQKKYEKEHADFEAYKTAQAEKETTAAKETAYRELLKTSGVAEKRIDTIMKVTSLEDLKLGKDGKLENLDDLKKSITETWADFITSEEKAGAEMKTPPSAGGSAGISKEEFAKMGYQARLKLYTEDRETYDALTKTEN